MGPLRWGFVALMTLHGLIHLMGAAKAFGLAELPQLSQPISRIGGLVWLVAALALIGASVTLLAVPRWWWLVGLLGVAVSQAAIVSSWGDARFGTIANVLVLGGVVLGFASQGPWSFRAHYDALVREHSNRPVQAAMVREVDLAELPEPVACYLRRSGAVGQPRPTHFWASWRGRIRATAEDDWMEFTAEQHNFIGDPARLFIMRASRGGLPVDVLHVFADAEASMKVKLLSLFPMVDVDGPDLVRAETVTVLNDLAILAPAGLLDDAVSLEPIDANSAAATMTVGKNTVRAVLKFNDDCDLVNFVSDDRLAASPDKKSFTPLRWSTPLRDHRSFGAHRAPAHGEGRWHPPEGEFAYLELELVDLRIDGAGG